MKAAEYLFEQAVMTIRAGRRDEASDMLAEVITGHQRNRDVTGGI